MKKGICFVLALLLALSLLLPVYGEQAFPLSSLGETRLMDYNGLSIPVFSGEDWKEIPVHDYYFFQIRQKNGYTWFLSIDPVTKYSSAVGDETTVTDYFSRLRANYYYYDSTLLCTVETIEDFPIYIMDSSNNNPGNYGTGSVAMFRYIRGTQDWTVRLGVFPDQKDGSLPVPDGQDLVNFAGKFSYNEADSEVGLKASTKTGETTIISGIKLGMVATFSDTNLVTKKEKNDTVEWSVWGENGSAPEGVSINKNGVLSADPNKVRDVLTVTVQARSESYKTRDRMQIRVVPRATKIAADPKEVFFYLGTPASQTVRAVLDPETVPVDLLSWSIPKEDLVTLTPGTDGTAVIATAAEKKGKAVVTLNEAGGRSTQIRVTILEPVTELELKLKGTPKQGGAVTVQNVITPASAGNKTLEWSLDVDDSIATINDKGQVKIKKDVPAGTKITVTCKAIGAPEPIVRTLEIVTE